MAYPSYPTVPHPCGTAVWPPADPGDPVIIPDPGLFIQDGDNGSEDISTGEDGMFKGDYVVVGAGTRNAGQGNFKFFLPKGVPVNAVNIDSAWLITNTYVADSVPDPTGGAPFTLKHENDSGAEILTGPYEFWCGSTCWINLPTAPPSFPVTTYLRNRIYVNDVTTYVTTWTSGNYTVGGLPLTTPLQPISTDGDRLPGCASSQGSVLLVIYKYGANPPKNVLPRCIQIYLGARLISISGPWGGVVSQLLTFNQTKPGPLAFSGNAKVTLAAGDTQTTVAGDRAAVNNTTFKPPNNSFQKIGSSLSVITQDMSNIYAGNNQLFVETSNDCVSWFLFAISADKTQPKANFKPVKCTSTALDEDITTAIQPTILVKGNNSLNPFFANCINEQKEFPDAPFYIKIENEIMLVTEKTDEGAAVPPNQQPRRWTVTRGAGGTTAVAHSANGGAPGFIPTCVKMIMPIEGKSQMQAALAKSGLPRSRPGTGLVNNRNRRQGF